MTVKDLISLLSDYPQDARVLMPVEGEGFDLIRSVKTVYVVPSLKPLTFKGDGEFVKIHRQSVDAEKTVVIS